MKMFGGRTNELELTVQEEAEQTMVENIYKRLSCKEKLAPYLLKPDGKKILCWNLLMGFVLSICFVIDPLIFVYELKPLESSDINYL